MRQNRLETELEANTHTARVARKVVDSADRVVQRVGCSPLLGFGVLTIPVSEALLGPDQCHAVWSRRHTILGDPGGAALPAVVDAAERQVYRSIRRDSHARGLCFALNFVGVGGELVLLFIQVPDVVGLSKDLNDVAEIQDVSGIEVCREVQPTDPETLGQAQVQVLEGGQTALVQAL